MTIDPAKYVAITAGVGAAPPLDTDAVPDPMTDAQIQTLGAA